MLFRFVEIDSPLDFCKMEDETPFHNCTKTKLLRDLSYATEYHPRSY